MRWLWLYNNNNYTIDFEGQGECRTALNSFVRQICRKLYPIEFRIKMGSVVAIVALA